MPGSGGRPGLSLGGCGRTGATVNAAASPRRTDRALFTGSASRLFLSKTERQNARRRSCSPARSSEASRSHREHPFPRLERVRQDQVLPFPFTSRSGSERERGGDGSGRMTGPSMRSSKKQKQQSRTEKETIKMAQPVERPLHPSVTVPRRGQAAANKARDAGALGKTFRRQLLLSSALLCVCGCYPVNSGLSHARPIRQPGAAKTGAGAKRGPSSPIPPVCQRALLPVRSNQAAAGRGETPCVAPSPGKVDAAKDAGRRRRGAAQATGALD